MKAFAICMALLGMSAMAFAANEMRGEQNEAVSKACKQVRYKNLPTDLKKFMRKMKCNVTSRSSYDYGYALDLNADGKPEYAFCCTEAPHGPCGMKIFGKPAGTWIVLLDDMTGYLPDAGDGAPGCGATGFTVLKERHEGYSDIRMDIGDEGSIIFRNGKYRHEEGTPGN